MSTTYWTSSFSAIVNDSVARRMVSPSSAAPADCSSRWKRYFPRSFAIGGGAGPKDSNFDAECLACCLESRQQRLGDRFGDLFDRPANDDASDAAKGRVIEFASMDQFGLGELFVVVTGCGLDRRVLGRERLHDDTSTTVTASRAAGHLSDQLKRALGGSEIGEVQGTVGVDHANQQHVGKVEPFRDHLCAQEDVDLSAAECREHFLVAARLAHRVAIHPCDGGIAESSFHFRFQSLGPEPSVADPVEPTGGAPGRCRDGVITVMAHRFAAIPVVSQRHVTIGTGNHVSARRALNGGGKPTSIQQ